MGWDIVIIGMKHNLPIEDPVATAKRLSPLCTGPISIGYDERWEYYEVDNIIKENPYSWHELDRIDANLPGETTDFSIQNGCAKALAKQLGDRIKSVKFDPEDVREWFMHEAFEEPFAIYELEGERYSPDNRVFKEIVELHENFPGRWSQFHHLFSKPYQGETKKILDEFRDYVYFQMRLCGCTDVYYICDQGPAQILYDEINRTVADWKDYMMKSEYLKNGENVSIFNISDYINHRRFLINDDVINVFYDDFADMKS